MAPLCSDCLQRERRKIDPERHITRHGLPTLVTAAIAAAFIGAAIWAGLWSVEARLINWLFPHFEPADGMSFRKIILRVFCSAFIIGIPIGLIVGFSPRGSLPLRRPVAIVSCLLSAMLGDAFFIYLQLRMDGVPFSIIESLKALPGYWTSSGSDTAYRFAVLAVTMAAAAGVADVLARYRYSRRTPMHLTSAETPSASHPDTR